MMHAPSNRKHAVTIEKGQVKFADRFTFNQAIREFEGRKAWLVIQGRKNTRTLSQNAYYWGVVVDMLAKYLGYFPDEIHEVLKQKFLPMKTIQLKDEELIIARSTSTLGTIEFEEYLNSVRTWAARDLNFEIPLPNEDL